MIARGVPVAGAGVRAYTRGVRAPDHARHWCEVLATHRPCDERERISIAEFLDVVPELVAPFDEHADPSHITASAVVVGESGTTVALHLHKRLGLWLQPGGHVESGETVFEAALREACEETGLPVRHASVDGEFVHVDVHPGPRGHRHFDLRALLVSPEVEPAPAEGESPTVRWFGWDEALELTDEGLAGALRSIRSRIGG